MYALDGGDATNKSSSTTDLVGATFRIEEKLVEGWEPLRFTPDNLDHV